MWFARKCALVLCLILTLPAMGDPNTFIKYRFESSKIVFDTLYTLTPADAQSFLVDVATQRTLGTFQKTEVVSTDEFIDAINKRLAEYETVAGDLRKIADTPLPKVEAKAVKVTPVEVINPPEVPVQPAAEDTALANQLAQIERNLRGQDLPSGYNSFVAIEQMVGSASSNSRLIKFLPKTQSIRSTFFTAEGLLKSQPLSDLSQAFYGSQTKDRFAVNMLNNCMINRLCNQSRFRMLMAPVLLFGSGKEAIGIRKQLDSVSFKFDGNTDLKPWIAKLSTISKLQETCKVDEICAESKKIFSRAAKEIYRCSEEQISELVDLIYTRKDNL